MDQINDAIIKIAGLDEKIEGGDSDNEDTPNEVLPPAKGGNDAEGGQGALTARRTSHDDRPVAPGANATAQLQPGQGATARSSGTPMVARTPNRGPLAPKPVGTPGMSTTGPPGGNAGSGGLASLGVPRGSDVRATGTPVLPPVGKPRATGTPLKPR